MHTRSSARGETTRVIATLLVLAACLVVVGRSVAPLASAPRATTVGGSARVVDESAGPAEIAAIAAAPSLHLLRAVENRIAPVWALPGLAASIAALCVWRRRLGDHRLAASRAFPRGSVASRAPPLASIA